MSNPTRIRNQQVKIRRRILIAALGGCCSQCGSTEKLEFHHTEPRDWIAAGQSYAYRQALYERDWDAGILDLYCKKCNQEAGEPPGEDASDNDLPF